MNSQSSKTASTFFQFHPTPLMPMLITLPQIAQAHVDASNHLHITTNNQENRNIEHFFETVNLRPTNSFFVDGGGSHDRRLPVLASSLHDTTIPAIGHHDFGGKVDEQ
ncbi:Hypothetical predicted protein, partial [Olea europaea subsp. europaea]